MCLFEVLSGDNPVRLDQIEIPDKAVGLSAHVCLCEEGVGGLAKLRTEKRPVVELSHSDEKGMEVNPAKTFKSRTKVEIQQIQLVPRDDPETATPDRKRVTPDFKSEMTPQADKAPAPKRCRSEISQEDDACVLKSMVEQKLRERADRKAQTALFQEAKAVLRAHGLDYNCHFQPAHKGKMAKGHWQLFLAGVMGKEDIDCVCCQQLMMTFGVSTLNYEGPHNANSSASASIRDLPDDVEPVADPCLAIVPFDPNYTPPKKRARAGRPRKDEKCFDTPSFNLVEYIEQKRVGVYRFLDREESTKRLSADKKRNFQMIAAEMAKRPAQCMLCGTYLHFPHISNDLVLIL